MLVFHITIIVPFAVPLASLLVEHVHALTLHGEMQLSLITLRCKYWLIRERQIVKSVLHKCLTCSCYAATSSVQRMGDFSKSRVTPDFPYNQAGVDYAGPVSICLSTLAVKTPLRVTLQFLSA